MEFLLTDPDIKPIPPANTRLLDLRSYLYPDGKRLRVALDQTPFQQKPYIEHTLTDSAGEVVTTTSIVASVVCRLDHTLHIHNTGATIAGVYNL
jgi:hypothetical protein